MNCPNCSGTGNLTIFNKKNPIIICDICQGTGELPENIIYDPIYGADLKKGRTDEGLTLRQYCLAFGVNASERSKQERGFFRKEEK